MERASFDTSDSPKIVIENISGSLRIKGWDDPIVRVDADRKNSITSEQKKDTVTLSCDRDCFIRVPQESVLVIENVAGETYVKFLEGTLKIDNIADDLYLKDVGTTEIENVNGHFSARQVEGDLMVESVQGSADIRDVTGNISLETIQGNLKLREVGADLSASVNGGADLWLDPEPEANIKVHTQGNITCKLPEFASAEVRLRSEQGLINIKIPGGSETIRSNNHELILSHGESDIILDAQGTINLKTQSDTDEIGAHFEFEFNEGFSKLADEITDQVSGQIEAQIEMLNEKLSNLSSGIAAGATARAEAAARRAERKVASTQKRLERKMAAARRKAVRKTEKHAGKRIRREARRSRHYNRSFSSTRPSDPVSDEERQMVLQMIQDKKLTVDDAEKILAALEGHSPASPEVFVEIPDQPDMADLEALADLSETFSAEDISEEDDTSSPKTKKSKKSKSAKKSKSGKKSKKPKEE
ncbi:MAG: hypothetical protein FVQ83_02515 [Chloroflexi bacterium]|nr:hypothetical protein [Chloroflexota bacterium]